MKKLIKFMCVTLCFIMCFALCACSNGKSKTYLSAPNTDNYWREPSTDEDNSSWDSDLTPNITITEIDPTGNKKEEELEDEIEAGQVDGIYSLISSAVTKDLEERGFTCGTGVAQTIENDNYSALGIYYYNNEAFKMFDDESLQAVGFVEIVSEEDEHLTPDEEESLIVVTDVSDVAVASEQDEIQKVCVYNYESINTYHFVYQNQYVMFYQESPMRVVYSTKENKKSNYDLTLGSLYDYDNKVYLYDESIFGEYKSHTAVELFGEEDYAKLEVELQQISEAQYKAGYNVDEFKIVYISPESIQAYLSSEEDATFFGYDVDTLTEEFGLGTALQFNGVGFEKATILKETDTGYNWKSFLIKAGIGCGIILAGAILSPVTGGASFGCALWTISKVAVSYALSSAVGTLAIETVSGLINGKSIEEALRGATYKGLDAFANGFMVGAAIGSVGVVIGAIKPKACFVAGTPILMQNNAYKNIEAVNADNVVMAYNENTGKVSPQKVIAVMKKEVDETLKLTLDNEIIETTPNHPFYLPKHKVWVTADSLNVGDELLSVDGSLVEVNDKQVVEHFAPVTVYNFTVANDHTYYVGENSILVHNECKTLQGKRNKAVHDAWKQEKQAVLDGTSKYNWTPKQKAELLKKGKVSGFEGAHIIDVKQLVGTSNEKFISSPDNIVLMKKADHLAAHKYNYKNPTDPNMIVEFVPWAADKVAKMLKLVA